MLDLGVVRVPSVKEQVAAGLTVTQPFVSAGSAML